MEIKSCRVCQLNKGSTIKRKTKPIITNANWEMVAMDMKGKLRKSIDGFEYILVIMDLFSKYVLVFLMKSITSHNIIKILQKHVIPTFGIPTKILTDRGTNFLSVELCKYFITNGIKKINITPYHPQSNGSVERFNRTLGMRLRMLTE